MLQLQCLHHSRCAVPTDGMVCIVDIYGKSSMPMLNQHFYTCYVNHKTMSTVFIWLIIHLFVYTKFLKFNVVDIKLYFKIFLRSLTLLASLWFKYSWYNRALQLLSTIRKDRSADHQGNRQAFDNIYRVFYAFLPWFNVIFVYFQNNRCEFYELA